MNKIQMAAKLYDARDSMKRLFGDEYPAKITQHRAYIETSMKQNNIDALHAMMRIIYDGEKKEAPEYKGCKVLKVNIDSHLEVV